MNRLLNFNNSIATRMMLAATLIISHGYINAQELPQLKVDFSMNRNKPAETQEPGFQKR